MLTSPYQLHPRQKSRRDIKAAGGCWRRSPVHKKRARVDQSHIGDVLPGDWTPSPRQDCVPYTNDHRDQDIGHANCLDSSFAFPGTLKLPPSPTFHRPPPCRGVLHPRRCAGQDPSHPPPNHHIMGSPCLCAFREIQREARITPCPAKEVPPPGACNPPGDCPGRRLEEVLLSIPKSRHELALQGLGVLRCGNCHPGYTDGNVPLVQDRLIQRHQHPGSVVSHSAMNFPGA